jgi:hypothetical protein
MIFRIIPAFRPSSEGSHTKKSWAKGVFDWTYVCEISCRYRFRGFLLLSQRVNRSTRMIL